MDATTLKPIVSRILIFTLPAHLLLMANGSVSAQEAPASQPTTATAPATLPAPDTATTQPAGTLKSELSIPAIEEQLSLAQDDTSHDDATKAKLVDLLTRARDNLRTANELAEMVAGLQQEIDAAPANLAAAKEKLAQPQAEPKLEVPENATLPQLEQGLSQAEAALAEAKKRLQDFQDAPQVRDALRKQFVETEKQNNADLAEIAGKLKAAAPEGEPPAVSRAERLRLLAREKRLKQQLATNAKQLAVFDATAELVSAQRDLIAREVAQQEKLRKAWQTLVTKTREQQVRAQLSGAERLVRDVMPANKPIAELNTKLAEQRSKLKNQLNTTAREAEKLEEQLAAIEKSFADLEKQVGTERISTVTVLHLRKAKAELPKLPEHRQRLRDYQEKLEAVEEELFRLSEERSSTVRNPDEYIATFLDEITPRPTREEAAALEKELRELVLPKVGENYDALINDFRAYRNDLLDVAGAEDSLIRVASSFSDFIDEHILWIRSHAPLNVRDVGHAFQAGRWLLAPKTWTQFADMLWRDLRRDPVTPSLSMIVLFGLGVSQWRWRKQLHLVGKQAVASDVVSFSLTSKAVLITLMLGLFWPLVMLYVAWRLGAFADSSELAGALRSGFIGGAIVLATMETFRQTCRTQGLADVHLHWRLETLKIIRRELYWLMSIVVPTAFLVGVMNAVSEVEWQGSLGRFAFIVGEAAIAVFMFRLLKPSGPVVASWARHEGPNWYYRLRHLWSILAVGMPIILLIMAAAGYYYAAKQLSVRLQATVWVILTVLIIRGIVLRWLVLTRRRLAIEQARQAREERMAKLRTEGAAQGTPKEIDVPIEEQKVDVSAISEQTSRLFGTALTIATAVAMYFVWIDVMPALTRLKDVSVGGTGVTAAGLGMAVIAALLTVVAIKNIPGLLEITILQKLPIDSGARYAINTVCRYLIILVGGLITANRLGINWSSVQWMAAAVTVGLGFGLQEIFANFVSGLIILFERPIRVGDTVTVGGVSGVVTKIRIRATTITDWDRKELILPNKEFVTGQVINWTLSDPKLRAVLSVGVAYGSDIQKVEDTLMRIAKEHSNVLEDPAPMVVFTGFGDSTLDFELRVHMPSIDNFLGTQHELRKAIDREFREAKIEIAFPQRDIHIRSIQSDVPLVDKRGAKAQGAEGQRAEE